MQTGGGRGPVLLSHHHPPHQPGVPPAQVVIFSPFYFHVYFSPTQASPQQIGENRNPRTILCCDFADTRTAATILIKTDNPVVYYVYFISDEEVLYFCRNMALFWMNKIRTVILILQQPELVDGSEGPSHDGLSPP